MSFLTVAIFCSLPGKKALGKLGNVVWAFLKGPTLLIWHIVNVILVFKKAHTMHLMSEQKHRNPPSDLNQTIFVTSLADLLPAVKLLV